MALIGAACLAGGLLLAGCGRSVIPPEAVVRAWSDAVNTGEDERAARLFARGAIAIRGNREADLHSLEDAIAWNKALSCGGLARKVATHGDIVTATFELADRAGSVCSAHGGSATYEFEVRRNRIVFLRLLSLTPAPPGTATSATGK